jgi:hypothetical protein
MGDDAALALANIRRTATNRRERRCNHEKTFIDGHGHMYLLVL